MKTLQYAASDKKVRMIYLDVLKTIAIFSVLIIHLTPLAFISYPPLSPSYIFTVVLSCASRFCVPVFVMCSGAVFLNSNKKITAKKIYTKYIPRVLFALILFAILYEVFSICLVHDKTGVWDITASINNILTFNTNFHLYYLYIIMLLYALIPPLKIFIKSAHKSDCIYVMVFLFITGSILPFVRNFYPLNHYFGGMTLQYALNLSYSMLMYFFLGFYLSQYDLSKKLFKLTIILGIFGFFITFFATTFLIQKNGCLDETFLNSLSPFIFFKITFSI